MRQTLRSVVLALEVLILSSAFTPPPHLLSSEALCFRAVTDSAHVFTYVLCAVRSPSPWVVGLRLEREGLPRLQHPEECLSHTCHTCSEGLLSRWVEGPGRPPSARTGQGLGSVNTHAGRMQSTGRLAEGLCGREARHWRVLGRL